uniref:Secreted peptide n=1 Tax=Anopheles braziliensis TaxID=58242 RepID=A0A2M3ZLT6_9DIPT
MIIRGWRRVVLSRFFYFFASHFIGACTALGNSLSQNSNTSGAGTGPGKKRNSNGSSSLVLQCHRYRWRGTGAKRRDLHPSIQPKNSTYYHRGGSGFALQIFTKEQHLEHTHGRGPSGGGAAAAAPVR